MYDTNICAPNPLPFLAYCDSTTYQQLIKQEKRKEASFNRLAIKSDLDQIFHQFGSHSSYLVNYRRHNIGDWKEVKQGWDEVQRRKIYPFRHIDFLNVLLGANKEGTAVGLCDVHQPIISNLRIDFDFAVMSSEGVVRLGKEIQEKLAMIGLDVFFFCTGNRGIQALIPLPSKLPKDHAWIMYRRLRSYLATDLAKLDVSNLEKFLRLPLGLHATSNNLGLFFSPDTESYVSISDQLLHYKNSWQWQHPIHIPDALTPDAFKSQAQNAFSFIPNPPITIAVKKSQNKLAVSNTWAETVWQKGETLGPGQWQSYLLEDHALHATFILFGNDACKKLEELAARIPARSAADITDRIKVVRSLWKSFIPIQQPKDSSDTLKTMIATGISSETQSEADALFGYIQRRQPTKNKWINQYVYEYILAVLHGLNCSKGIKLTISVDEMIQYLQTAEVSKMSRQTLLRIIKKSTQPPPQIGFTSGSSGSQTIAKNELAVFIYDPGTKMMKGATPGSFMRIPGLKHDAKTEMNGPKP